MKLLMDFADGKEYKDLMTDPDKYYLCYNEEFDEDGNSSKYLAYFQGSGNYSTYSELFAMTCHSLDISETHEELYNITLKVFNVDNPQLETGQTYFASDTIFELTDEEVLSNVLLEFI